MGFLHRHSLSLVSACVALVWLGCYCISNPGSHWGSFFGNATADWTGLVVTVLATKHLYEARGKKQGEGLLEMARHHKVTLFLLITGLAWVVAFIRMDSEARWGQVVGNLVSEWTQNLGFVLLTKKFIEQSARTHS